VLSVSCGQTGLFWREKTVWGSPGIGAESIMANFCVKCGGGLDAGASFCRQCGSQVSGVQEQAQAPSPMPPAAPAKGGSIFKFLIIAFLVMVALCMTASVGIYFYAKSKVQEKMAEFKEKTGVDVGAAIESAGQSRPYSGGRRDGCLLLTKQEAERILGVTLTRTDGSRSGSSSEEHCDYYADASAAKASAEEAGKHFEALSKPNSGRTADLKDLEGVMKGLGASMSDGSSPYFQVTIFRDNAKIAITGMNAGTALSGGKLEAVAGPWDEAMFGVLNTMMTVRKGDQGFMIDLRQLTGGREKGLELAKVIAGRL
jgi:hypothetical protein